IMAELQNEVFFLRQNIRRVRQARCIESSQLLDSVSKVRFLLVAVLITCGGPFSPEDCFHFFKWQALPLPQGANELLDGCVHHIAEGGGCGRTAAKIPHLAE